MKSYLLQNHLSRFCVPFGVHKWTYPILIFAFFFLGKLPVALAQEQPLINSTLEGQLLDAHSREPLEGASIAIEGTAHKAVTNSRGEFRFVTGEEFPYTVTIKYVGYKTLNKTVDGGSPVEILLEPALNQLQDIVITGYSTQSRKDYTGSVARIGAEQIENRPLQSFDQALGGQAAGVDIIQSSGTLNNTPVFRIRGINSISSGIYPLIIIDGVPSFTGLVGGTVGNNPLSNINPNDIESIDVLKDASATAIYGSRAANGVVVVTTKKGKQGRSKVNYDSYINFSTPFNLLELLDAYDYVDLKNEAMVNAGLTPGYALETRSDGSTVNTDWYDVAYHTGVSHNHNVNFSGATENTSYFVSAGYTDQQGIIRTNTLSNKLFRANLEHKLTDRITVGTRASASNSVNRGPNTGNLPGQYIGLAALGRMTYILPPNVAVYNEDGSYNIQDEVRVGYGANNSVSNTPGYVGTINAYNLQLLLDQDNYSSESIALIGDVYAEWEILKGLKLKTAYGLNRLNVENLSFQNPVHGDAAAANGAATNSNRKLYRTNWTNTLNYDVSWADRHNLNVLAGYEEIFTSDASWGARRLDLTDPLFDNYQGGFTTITPINNFEGKNGFQSYFTNINYNFDSKYLLSYSFRRDGYSGLPRGHQFGNFNGGSVGWAISEENFYKESGLSNVIDYLKVRASYGEVGNIDIGNFPALGLYNAGTYSGVATLGFSQAGNDNLRWETSKKQDIGLYLSLLNGKVTFEADYYYNKIDGMVLEAQQALSKGIPNSTISTNIGSMYNKGLEFTLNAAAVTKPDFSWNINLNFSTLSNKVLALANDADLYQPSAFGIQNVTRIGYSVGSIWAVNTAGVNPDNGSRIFVNRNGDLVQYDHASANRWTYLDGSVAPAIDNYLDGSIQGPSLPKFYGGFNNTLTYKDFDINLIFTFSGGNKLYNGTRANLLDQRYFNNGTFALDRWTTPGQETDIPRLVYADNVSTGFSITNAAMVEKGDYLKIKDITIGYRLPVQRFIKQGVSSLRIYAQATNLFTITGYTGSDPEISINGNSINSGKDHNAIPNATTYSLGLNLGF